MTFVYIASSSSNSTAQFNRSIDEFHRAQNEHFKSEQAAHINLIHQLGTLTFDQLILRIDELPTLAVSHAAWTYYHLHQWKFPEDKHNNTLFDAILTVKNDNLTKSQRAEAAYYLFRLHPAYMTLFHHKNIVKILVKNAEYHEILMRMYSEICSHELTIESFLPSGKDEKLIWDIYLQHELYQNLLAPFLVTEHKQEFLLRMLSVCELKIRTSADPIASYREIMAFLKNFTLAINWGNYLFEYTEFVLLEKLLPSQSAEEKTTKIISDDSVTQFLNSAPKPQKTSFFKSAKPVEVNPLIELHNKIRNHDEKAADLLQIARKAFYDRTNAVINKTFKK